MDYLKRLEKLMSQLRSKKGCPWDKRQTHKSLKPYLLEETHETLDAIDSGDAESLREELGDVLLQVVFHSQLAKEKGRFNLQDVAQTIGDKLIRRHPHVFGKGASRKIADINRKWEELKRQEKPERKSVLDFHRSLTAGNKKAKDKSAGEFLLAFTRLAQSTGIHAEMALSEASSKFEKNFRKHESNPKN
jgi:MazG family protein